MILRAAFALALALPTTSTAEELPRVLLLGDSAYGGVSGAVGKELKGGAVVVTKHPGDTSSALADLDDLLGKDDWAVIHFNFGLADLHYKDPRTKAVRAMSKSAGGVRVTSPERYEKNLRELTRRLKATGAKLVWASTTPIEGGSDDLFDAGSEVEYNAVAVRVMKEFGVPVNDLHGFVREQRAGKQARNPFDFKGIALHTRIAGSIRRALPEN